MTETTSSSTTAPKHQPLAPGDRIFYRGDMANPAGWLTVTRVHPPDRWSATSYDCEFDPADRDCGDFERQEIRRLADSQVSRVDQGNGATRFVTAEAYRAFRNEQLAALHQRLAGGGER
ncbi:MAG: hypothetical protein F9K16_06660 [Thermoanaerobaculia bacterium]|nr:MAG: hypothetical protein F9K16_06660 [Thermoanaerobaculia bacterium]MBZ0101082.1 hypothetical protein [Thermoanaerobaculia bacterium]